MDRYDVVVVGAGHAGCEAAFIAASMGARACLVTIHLDAIARMSCNPAIGGLAKGQLVREIDVLGGVMARATDATGIQFRMLNMSKGPAVRSPRAQADRELYARWMKSLLEETPGLDLRQGVVTEILTDSSGACGVMLQCGTRIASRAVIITTGTFLDGQVHIGLRKYPAGRAGEPPSCDLPRSLEQLGLTLGRFMTDTPPRLDGRTIDYSGLEVQHGDDPPRPFSFSTRAITRAQVPCHITWTNPETHKIILDHIRESPVFAGKLDAIPPRYCPDIETKIVRYPDKERHQIFLEPEGLSTREVYPNGIFTTLSEETQRLFIRTIRGLENARMTRPAYGIEYTYAPPCQLQPTCEVRAVPFLFHAGQINGTSGYEEAAAQGLVAGINAVLRIRGEEPLILRRDEAYIGVLMDDLVSKDISEPYRMFTSRAEYRLLLRHDNADLRLMDQARRIGTADDARYDAFMQYRDAIQREVERLNTSWVKTGELDGAYMREHGLDPPAKSVTAAQFLARPEMSWKHLAALGLTGEIEEPRTVEQIEIMVKYEGYIQKQMDEIRQARKMDERVLPGDLEYTKVQGLTREAVEKLDRFRPMTLGQASRIAGVSPADVTVLLIHLKARQHRSA
ncbi:MAG TPA: tRNA uridine-5-carboxymethylaminomethyl(34) synthesis enzyme MnmG [Candidatus Sumerlaeota bacterium]|nr:tRNA uridine-5-carboxymethylaminomethyl(34) synthesis enzyme MnmG [Candidatus Sumerlaeota bacterium]